MVDEVQDTLGTQAAKDELAKGMRAFKAFENAHLVLSRLESLEQDVSETEKRLADLKEEEGSFLDLKFAAQSEAAQIVKDAREEAKNIEFSSSSEAGKSLADAKKQALEIVSSAKSEAADYIEKSAALKAENDEVTATLAGAKAELAAIKQAVAQYKADLKKFVG